MKNMLKKVTAGISAVAVSAALSATTIPAFASEYEASMANTYVASFDDDEVKQVAQYCLDNGMTLEETKDTMTHYLHGLELIENRTSEDNGISTASVSTGRTFYSATNVASTQHYGVIIVDNPSSSTVTTIKLGWDTAKINCPNDSASFLATCQMKNGYPSLAAIATEEVEKEGFTVGAYGMLPQIEENDLYTRSLLTFPFSLISSTSEANIKGAFKFSYSSSALNGKTTGLELHTYALGDFDHSGKVDDADGTYALQFLVRSFDGVFKYTNVHDNVASAVNFLALDANMDGSITISDANLINKWAVQ
ncbi:hypothetical protein [Ruminococcus sp.]|uniref:hypothetical protein n=1 Tax=Ruminococcus sp. TaxID=41978 RepID=UPI0025F387CE|nr:hypothetical protein [Ruminococcus sp.]